MARYHTDGSPFNKDCAVNSYYQNMSQNISSMNEFFFLRRTKTSKQVPCLQATVGLFSMKLTKY